jgi:ankyrin repeat protein
VNAESIEKETPLFESIIHNSTRCLSLLLRCNADYSRRNKRGNTVLHLAALAGKIPVFRVLARERLKNIDVDARDVDGFTAMDIVEDQRKGVTQELKQEFKVLLASVISAKVAVSQLPDCGGESEDDIADEFADAVECQVGTGREG